MTRPVRTCRFCGAKGKWTSYMIWDKARPEVGTGKHKWWICPECDKKMTEEENKK